MRLKSKHVLITGASSGIGEATAYRVAESGGVPILIGRNHKELARVKERVDQILSSLNLSNPSVIFACDLTIDKERDSLLVFLNQNNFIPDILINNAGVTFHGLFEGSSLDSLRQTMEINFFAMADLTSKLLPYMKKRSGRKGILLVSTPSGLYGVPRRFAYSASKAAGHALMESLRVELRQDDFQVQIFCPGYTMTNLRNRILTGDGSVGDEGQHRSAKSPDVVAKKLCKLIQKGSRYGFTGINGRGVYWLRTLSPKLLEYIMFKKFNH